MLLVFFFMLVSNNTTLVSYHFCSMSAPPKTSGPPTKSPTPTKTTATTPHSSTSAATNAPTTPAPINAPTTDAPINAPINAPTPTTPVTTNAPLPTPNTDATSSTNAPNTSSTTTKTPAQIDEDTINLRKELERITTQIAQNEAAKKLYFMSEEKQYIIEYEKLAEGLFELANKRESLRLYHFYYMMPGLLKMLGIDPKQVNLPLA